MVDVVFQLVAFDRTEVLVEQLSSYIFFNSLIVCMYSGVMKSGVTFPSLMPYWSCSALNAALESSLVGGCAEKTVLSLIWVGCEDGASLSDAVPLLSLPPPQAVTMDAAEMAVTYGHSFFQLRLSSLFH
ncbi:hypothetical protein ACFQ88_24190 [Paenibacillus sp. NPDC056579]|uniref:hypothetical protein n=1 Tax=Paenibacillus sp. NPDC056579 TaxID=3345871 RepID=UPI00369F8C20